MGVFSDLSPEWGVVIGASLGAAYCDVRTRRVPNWLTLPLAVAGVICAGSLHGLTGLGEATGAWIVLALPYILLFSLGHGGAGDAKMMGAIGTWLGLRQGVVVLGCVAVVGAVLALMRLAVHGQRRRLFRNLLASLYVFGIAFAGGRSGWALLRTNSTEQARESGGSITFPYGVAIFLGVCLGAIAVQLWMQ